MKKLIPFIFLITGCVSTQPSTQTVLHDLTNLIREVETQKESQKQFEEDCVIEQITFGKDSFGYYTKCPSDAYHLRREVMKKSTSLMKY